MWRRCALVLVVLLAPGVARAQEKLDNLLPAGSQVYLRWDGVTAHKADAEKLAVMKMWKGETGAHRVRYERRGGRLTVFIPQSDMRRQKKKASANGGFHEFSR